jgi:hypothetical protein
VVNPNNGPTLNSSSSDTYLQEIAKLNSYDNIRTIGYVRTNYSQRALDDVYNDINVYASWASNRNENISMKGIFFDECPNSYTTEIGQFMQQIDSYAKNSSGFGGFNYVLFCNGID